MPHSAAPDRRRRPRAAAPSGPRLDRAEVIAQLAGEVRARRDTCSRPLDDQQPVAGDQHDGRGGMPPGDISGIAGNSGLRNVEPILRLDRTDRQRARRGFDRAACAQPAGEHGFGQRDRRGMMAGSAQDCRRLDHTRRAIGEDIRIARLFDRVP